MFVEIRNGVAAVHDAADLKSLAVRADGSDLAAALAGLGEPADTGEHAWLSIDALKAAAGATVPPAERDAWAAGFDGMIAYATSKGWANPAGTHVRAHVEPA